MNLLPPERKFCRINGDGVFGRDKLIRVAEHQFMMRSVDYFKMEIEIGADGRAEKIVGYYSNRRRDESPRDG